MDSTPAAYQELVQVDSSGHGAGWTFGGVGRSGRRGDEGSGASGWPCKVEGPSELHGYAGRSTKTASWLPDLGPMERMFAVENKANEEETSCMHG